MVVSVSLVVMRKKKKKRRKLHLYEGMGEQTGGWWMKEGREG